MRASRGFTLIELLVVIAIIGILASTVLAAMSTARNKAKVAVAKTQVKDIEQAFMAFYAQKGDYPPMPLHTDFCNMCTYWPPSVPWANGDWSTDIEGQLMADGDIKTSFGTDPWGNPYLYDKNFEMGPYTCWGLSPICSMGPDGVLETPNCQATSTPPVVGGDDICVFLSDFGPWAGE